MKPPVDDAAELCLLAYVREALAVGRNYVSADSRARLGRLSEQVLGAHAAAVDESWDAFKRFLWCEHFTNRVAQHNYLSYTYSPVLDHYLGAADDFATLERKTWTTVQVLLADWYSFESASLRRDAAGAYHKQGYVRELIERRVAQLQGLLDGLDLRENTLSLHRADAVPAHEYASDTDYLCAADDGLLGLAALTGLPSSNYHDEYMFLRVVQISECIFNVLGQGIRASAALYRAADHAGMVRIYRHLNFHMDVLLRVFGLLDTLKVGNFVDGFRSDTGNAGAIQSNKYQYLESILSGMSAEKIDTLHQVPDILNKEQLLRPTIPTLRQMYQALLQAGVSPELEYFSRRLLQGFQSWKARHYGVAVKQLPGDFVGNGFGGLRYLRSNLKVNKMQFTQQQGDTLQVRATDEARRAYAGLMFGWIELAQVDLGQLGDRLAAQHDAIAAEISAQRDTILRNLGLSQQMFAARGLSSPIVKQFDKGLPGTAMPIVPRFLLNVEFYRGMLAGLFDLTQVSGDILIDIGLADEKFAGMGGREVACRAGDLVLRDGKGIVASYFAGPGARTAVGGVGAAPGRYGLMLFGAHGLGHEAFAETARFLAGLSGQEARLQMISL
jgi:hypothetical protein